MFYLGKTSKRRLIGVDPRWLQIIDLALALTLIDFGIPGDGGLRSDERQMAMFIDPNIKTNCDGITSRSKHQDGLAIDFYAYVDGKASWKPEYLAHITAAILQAASILGFKVRSGMFFRPGGWDKPHVELIG